MELPIPDFDHLPLPALGHRIRTLDLAGLDTLIEHETAHGNRLPVLTQLRARRDELAAGAEPSGGDPAGTTPETADTPHGSPVDPSGSPQAGPPDRHGLRQVTWGG